MDEIEVKFYLDNFAKIKQSLQHSAAKLVHARVHEVNLRFDLPDGSLTREHRVLRLRQDTKPRLTYKAPNQPGGEVTTRREIEFVVSSFEEARDFLEALGYTISTSYEKFRTTYHLNTCYVVLDEMPFGSFAEIEGGSAAIIQETARMLDLEWEARILDSYMGLFERLIKKKGLKVRNLTFNELNGITISPADLGVAAADRRVI